MADKPITKATLAQAFSDCADFIIQDVAVGSVQAFICCLDGVVTALTVAETVVRPLTDSERFGDIRRETDAIERIMQGAVYGTDPKLHYELNGAVSDIVGGRCAVIFPRSHAAVTFDVRSVDKRAISEPKEEKSVKGAKDAFTELLRTNTMLVRRKLKTADLKLRELSVGRLSATQVAILYIDGLTNPEYVEELTERLGCIDIDGAVSAANIEAFITDKPRSPFPQLMTTERPDRFASNLLEGRVGLIIDGLPLGYLAPAPLSQFIKVPEDSAEHYIVASCLTLLRYIALLISLLLPAVYVAIALYHQEMLPTKLMQSIIDSKQAVPFPTWLEALAMLAAFDLLQEAGLRLPNTIGSTVSIIGALIVGQSAVEAKVVSPVVVIVIALAGISGYTIPNQDLSAAVRICRFLMVTAAIAGGMFGVATGVILLVYHLASIDTFGVPYLYPFSDAVAGGVMRAVFKCPEWRLKTRERVLKPQRIKRVK